MALSFWVQEFWYKKRAPVWKGVLFQGGASEASTGEKVVTKVE